MRCACVCAGAVLVRMCAASSAAAFRVQAGGAHLVPVQTWAPTGVPCRGADARHGSGKGCVCDRGGGGSTPTTADPSWPPSPSARRSGQAETIYIYMYIISFPGAAVRGLGPVCVDADVRMHAAPSPAVAKLQAWASPVELRMSPVSPDADVGQG